MGGIVCLLFFSLCMRARACAPPSLEPMSLPSLFLSQYYQQRSLLLMLLHTTKRKLMRNLSNITNILGLEPTSSPSLPNTTHSHFLLSFSLTHTHAGLEPTYSLYPTAQHARCVTSLLSNTTYLTTTITGCHRRPPDPLYLSLAITILILTSTDPSSSYTHFPALSPSFTNPQGVYYVYSLLYTKHYGGIYSERERKTSLSLSWLAWTTGVRLAWRSLQLGPGERPYYIPSTQHPRALITLLHYTTLITLLTLTGTTTHTCFDSMSHCLLRGGTKGLTAYTSMSTLRLWAMPVALLQALFRW